MIWQVFNEDKPYLLVQSTFNGYKKKSVKTYLVFSSALNTIYVNLFDVESFIAHCKWLHEENQKENVSS